jgi:hypothetical protein
VVTTPGAENPRDRGLGAWSVNTYGGDPANTVNGGLSAAICNDPGNPCFISPIPPSPASLAVNGSGFAAHIFGPLYILAGKYESHQLIGRFRNSATNPYFDARPFSGLQCDVYVSSADTNLLPYLQIGIDRTTPPSAGVGGICLGTQCYNHYAYGLTNLGTNPGDDPLGNRAPLAGPDCSNPCRDTWVRLTLPWNRFAQTFGTNHGPLVNHREKFLLIQVIFSNDNVAASTNYTDFWVDNIEFLP